MMTQISVYHVSEKQKNSFNAVVKMTKQSLSKFQVIFLTL